MGTLHFSFSKRKGQSEVLIIVAILVLALVVIFYATQRFYAQEPEEVANIKASLKTEIEQDIRTEAFEVIEKIGAQGGYLDVSGLSTKFEEGEVAYWGICQNKYAPSLNDIKLNIEKGLEQALNNLNITTYQGKPISLEKPQDIEVIIRPDDVIVNIWMPTQIEGFQINQPYTIVVPVELGKAYDFASNFVEEESKQRHLSRFIASLIYHAKTDRLPTLGILSRCGEVLYIDRETAEKSAEELLQHAALNIILWKEPPQERDYIEYYIPKVNGKTYDMDMAFYVTEELNRNTFQPSKDPIFVANSKKLYYLLPVCVTGFDIRYNIRPSMVAQIETQKGYKFNFGIMPYVVDNKIGRCQGPENLTGIQNVCLDAKCEASLNVVDSQNQTIPQTKVYYGSCSLGETNGLGKVEGKIPCGVSQLVVTNPEYIPHADVVSSFEVENKQVELKKNPEIVFHFNHVVMEPNIFSGFGSSSITGWKRADIANLDQSIYVNLKQLDASPWFPLESAVTNINQNGELVLAVPVDTLPPGKYQAEINTIKRPVRYKTTVCVKKVLGVCTKHKRIDQEISLFGKTIYEFEISEGDRDIYINAPIPGMDTTSSTTSEYDYTGLTNKLKDCGIEPVSKQKPVGSCQL